jgi:mannose-6-phosphate isomerase-like protein (cupin superfamily)
VPIVDPNDLAAMDRLPGWSGRVFHSDSMTFAYWDITADAAPLHEHHHPNEEVWHVVEGEIVLVIDGVEHRVPAGCAAIVPPDTPHAALVRGPCRAIVADHPSRPEFGGVRISG